MRNEQIRQLTNEDAVIAAAPARRCFIVARETRHSAFSATPRGEPLEISDWAQPLVWTDRMLTTLHEGVRGGKWHTLSERVSPD